MWLPRSLLPSPATIASSKQVGLLRLPLQTVLEIYSLHCVGACLHNEGATHEGCREATRRSKSKDSASHIVNSCQPPSVKNTLQARSVMMRQCNKSQGGALLLCCFNLRNLVGASWDCLKHDAPGAMYLHFGLAGKLSLKSSLAVLKFSNWFPGQNRKLTLQEPVHPLRAQALICDLAGPRLTFVYD